MKKIKNFWDSWTKVDLAQAEIHILTLLTEFDGHVLTTSQQITLFNNVKTKLDLIVLAKKEFALKEIELCEYYKNNGKKIKDIVVIDPIFLEPIKK